MVLLFALAIVCLVGVISTLVVSVRDSRSPMRTVSNYDTRRPLP